MLPAPLRDALLEEAAEWSPAALAPAAEQLSEAYRSGRSFRFGADEQRVAYALVRMPATCAVLESVFREIAGIGARSLLDLGAGPGTAAWAAAAVFGPLDRVTLVEEDRRMIELGQKLARGLEAVAPPQRLDWRASDVRAVPLEPHDLVTLSYVAGELDPDQALHLLRRAWNAAARAIVVVEPGTPKGFARIRALRGELIALGAQIAAPCPHDGACPMSGGDWCHFSRRLERSAVHRRLKHGVMGYEDEKYSYLIAARSAPDRAAARILRHPLRYPGHLRLRLCTAQGLTEQTVTRSRKEAWKAMRSAAWGDRFPASLAGLG
jgi:ribosomal protein RSM22 (predicted rRNA methylase)